MGCRVLLVGLRYKTHRHLTPLKTPDNNRLHTEHSAGVLPESACLSCPVNLERYSARLACYLVECVLVIIFGSVRDINLRSDYLP